MRAIVIGNEARLRREIRKLAKMGFNAIERAGAVHLGRNTWISPLDLTRSADVQGDALPL